MILVPDDSKPMKTEEIAPIPLPVTIPQSALCNFVISLAVITAFGWPSLA